MLRCDSSVKHEPFNSPLFALTVYARTLLRPASVCLQVLRSNAMGLGIFDGDSLETRAMTLTEKRTSLARPV